MTLPSKTRLGFLRVVAHAAALVFSAWWLVATSAPIEPPRDCFTGIANPTRLTVTLGAAELPADGGTGQSCLGVDGLSSGASVTLDVMQGSRDEYDLGTCYGYAVTAVQGTMDVVVPDRTASFGSPVPALALANGRYGVAGGSTSCERAWSFWVWPDPPPAAGMVLSPFDSSAGQRWLLTREIGQGLSLCDDPAPQGSCVDTFVVDRIVEATP